jgi:hypothetical protein
MRASDTKHLHRRHRTWWLRLRTPLPVRRLHPHEPQFAWRNLRTRDLREAQRARHAAIAEAHARWERLLRDRPAEPEEIKRLAEVEMHRCFSELSSRLLEVNEQLESMLDEAGVDLFLGRLDPVAETMLRHEGFTVTTDTARALAEKLAEARRLAITALRTGMRLPDAPDGPPRAGDRPRGMPLADAITTYLAELRRPGGAMTAKTVDQIEKSLLLVTGYVPERATLAEVTRATAGQFVADLCRLDPAYRRDPEAPRLGLRQLLAKHPAGEAGGLAAATVQRHVSNIAGLWR